MPVVNCTSSGVTLSATPALLPPSHGIKSEHLPVMRRLHSVSSLSAAEPFFLLTLRSLGEGEEGGGHLMHSKQLKHFKPLNPDRRGERKGKSDIFFATGMMVLWKN